MIFNINFIKAISFALIFVSVSAFAEISESLPSGERWISHLKKDLLPFWMKEAAFGKPVGNFPTYRCNDGSVYNNDAPCIELSQSAPWIKKNLQRDFFRMKSRQTYAYGVAYHLTGDEKILDVMKKGVDFIRKYALDSLSGGPISYRVDNVAPPAQKTTSQDLAYIQLGLTFYYYLTRDEAVLQDIVKLKDYIFNEYYNPALDRLVTRSHKDSADSRHALVFQLDQVNAYMLLLTPFLPKSLRKSYEKTLVHLANIMMNSFYNEADNCFYRHIYDDEGKTARHAVCDNFGATIKAFLMIYHIGQFTNNNQLSAFSQSRMPDIFEKAFVKARNSNTLGFWASALRSDGVLDKKRNWWIYAELDQAAATLSLENPAFTKYLVDTYQYWFDYMVDKNNYEVWHTINLKGEAESPKVHQWKNGYHSMEHALVGYITSQALHDKPVILYYAFEPKATDVTLLPYFYSGTVKQKSTEGLMTDLGLEKIKVVFEKVH
jgi:mannose/cellobiose epimerase-like protein (N-acyl-D-glucosamine 2-epimerase family)